ncbi:MAG: GNAT family N-acetyltransferase [Magnetococcales bacterium]|nr:GNAT family N-acetyltransferase [Magnetococcales bacterium]
MRLIPFTDDHRHRWDAFVATTAQGVFLHSRTFLSYHRDRFNDLSILIEDDRGRLGAVFPAAQSPVISDQVVSHPGSTYGGLLHESTLQADEILSMLAAIKAWYARAGYRSLLYKVVPFHVQRSVAQMDLYALWRLGGTLVRRDSWNMVDLTQPRHSSRRHLRNLRNAHKAAVRAAIVDQNSLGDFYAILTDCLMDRHSTRPVHSIEEMKELNSLFPDHIQTWGAYAADGALIAGVWLFRLGHHCWHSQYIASNTVGRQLFAVSLLIESIIEQACQAGVRYFSLGASTEKNGAVLNAGLFHFKSGFGSGSVIQDFYEIDLTGPETL